MLDQKLKDKIIDEVCEAADVDPQVVRHLLMLESKHKDLMAWGARPGLRREISALLEPELEKVKT
jgi:hypothetical protein